MALQAKSSLPNGIGGLTTALSNATNPSAQGTSGLKGQTKQALTNSIVGGTTNTGGGYSGGGYGGGGSAEAYGGNSYADYLGALQAQRDALIAQANAALDEQGRLAENRYALQKEAADQDYQDLRNQSEVNRYKARGTLRQSLADRGAMDSGIGRQAYVNLANNYDNALNKISLQQKREDAEREQAKNEMWANIAMQKIANQMSGLDMFGNILSQLDPSMFMSGVSEGGYSYNPNTSNYYAAAQGSIAPVSTAGLTSGINNAQYTTGANSAARATAFDDILGELRKRQSTGYGVR